ncbi:MAG TPA: hypothetical protein VG889_13780 [Rhizomicrobium sp.]|nr:hypothetical protein [Rhizomicrobium sp.]
MNTKTIAALLAAGLMAGCTTTDPGSGSEAQFRMPHTDMKLTLGLTLESCGANGQTPTLAKADLSLAAVAGARPELWTFKPGALSTARTKRDIEIKTTDDGHAVIGSLNVAASDRTFQIAGNILKVVAQVAGAVLAAQLPPPPPPALPPPQPLSCRADIADAATRAANVKARIVVLRHQIAGATDPDTLEKLNKELNADATELAALRTGVLHVDTTADLKIDDTPLDTGNNTFGNRPQIDRRPIELNVQAFDTWFDTSSPDAQRWLAEQFGLTWTAAPDRGKPGYALKVEGGPNPDTCKIYMWVPAVMPVKVELNDKGKAYPSAVKLPSQQVPVSQWAAPKRLCLEAGLGEGRTVNLTFDKFGETTDMHWMSDARAENVTGAMAAAAPDAATLWKTLHPAATPTEQAETETVKTAFTRNCAEMIKAGAFSCPTPPPSP